MFVPVKDIKTRLQKNVLSVLKEYLKKKIPRTSSLF